MAYLSLTAPWTITNKEALVDYGMLWFDNDPKLDFLSKVQNAAAYYHEKYGIEPNLCFVHPNMIANMTTDSCSMAVWSSPTILPHHSAKRSSSLDR